MPIKPGVLVYLYNLSHKNTFPIEKFKKEKNMAKKLIVYVKSSTANGGGLGV